MTRNFLYLFAIIVMSFCVVPTATADDVSNQDTHEYRVRAAFIYNFLKFIQWPDGAPMKSPEVAKVCIAGDKDFAEYFRKLQVANKQGITIRISELPTYSEIPTCQLLFIGKDEEEKAISILAHINHHPVLSISEVRNFADNGGIIEIVKVGTNVGLFSQDKINLRINLKAAEAIGLSIDARLLQIAVEVIK